MLNYNSIWTIQHWRKGKLLWEDINHNALVQQGQEMILEDIFRGDATYRASAYYVRLCNSVPLVTTTLATLTGEPAVANGYAGLLLEKSTLGWPTKDINGNGNYRLTSKLLTFTASGGTIGPVSTAFLATTQSGVDGKLVATRALAMTRTIQDEDALVVQIQTDLS